jgi:lysophospholipase L1-like esterase
MTVAVVNGGDALTPNRTPSHGLGLVGIGRSLRLGVALLLAWVPGGGGFAFGADAPARTNLPTLYLIGDSTVNNPTKGLQGWGLPFAASFDPAQIRVENRARGGRSSRTYFTEGLWDQVRDALKPGDFVLMQFGHNDGGPLADGRARASLKGTGDETRDVNNKSTGKQEVVHTYGWYLKKFITETQARQATPIVLSLVPRNIWKEGKVTRASNDYGKWAAEAAHASGALFVDLNENVARHYEADGEEKVKRDYFIVSDHTHTTPAGAQLNAACVVEGLRALKGRPLQTFLLSTTPASSPARKPD